MAIELRLTNYSAVGGNFWAAEISGYRSPDMTLTVVWGYGYTAITPGTSLWVGIYQTGNPVPKWATTTTIPADWHKYRLEVNTGTLVDEGPLADIQELWYCYPGMSFWAVLNPASPPSVPVNTPLEIAVVWNTRGIAYSITGYAYLWLIDPGGAQISIAVAANQGNSASPGNGWAVTFSPYVLNKSGLWKAKAELHTP